MQTRTVLETISWLQGQISPIADILFTLAARTAPEANDAESDKRGHGKGISPDAVFSAIQLSGAIVERIQDNPTAVEVLNAFGLKMLHSPELVRQALSGLMLGPDRVDISSIRAARIAWNNMVGCLAPITVLTVPPILQSDAGRDEILTIQIEDRPEFTLGTFSEVLKATTSLFDAIGKAYNHPEASELGILKIESGTSITLSFKGVADTVREFKNLVVEIWNKHRHKRADEVINLNSAMTSSIDILTKIDDRVKTHSLDPETALRLKRAIVNNTFTLFKDGVLIADIPHIEVIDNRQLLSTFSSPKLIAPPIELEDEKKDHGGPGSKLKSQGKRQISKKK